MNEKLTIMVKMNTIRFPSGSEVPILGQGTWNMAEDFAKRDSEIKALRKGLDLGMSLIDTAEMYADGKAEELVAEALGNRRNEVFLVSKVLPENANLRGTIQACDRSLKRLKTHYLDLYLLHWRGSYPLEETLEAFQVLQQAGKIHSYGVSNFDVDDMEEALSLPGGNKIETNQVLYNLTRRGIEWDLLPWCHKRKIPIMAYSPIEQGRLLNHPILKAIGKRHAATPAQVALAWVLLQKKMIVIPKAGTADHVIENYGALNIKLSNEDLKELDQAFPPTKHKISLEML